MMNCYDEGTIQAFLDGELNFADVDKLTRHLAACDECAALLAVAEEESAFVCAAFAESEDFSPLVPSERLRSQVFASIAELETSPSFWERLKNFGSGWNFAAPQFAAVAVLLAVTSAAILLFVLPGQNKENDSLAQIQTAPVINSTEKNSIKPDAPKVTPVIVNPIKEVAPIKPTIAAYQPKIEKDSRKKHTRRTDVNYSENHAPAENLAGEGAYLKTIATLSETVNQSKDRVMKPSTRVEFERDLAVVDDAINRMSAEVHKNPRNEAAKDVLRASYQNKIDLLNSVAEKGELVASMR